jgi:DNA-binding transcriptional regulator GbsR (MarR family)
MDNKEYTVKDLAEQVGVSKQAIIDKIKKLGLQDNLARKGNRFVISESQANLILSAFQGKQQVQSTRNNANQNNDLLYELVKTLQQQLDEKDKQIAESNKQIERLTALNENLLKISEQSQQLHAGTIQTQLLTEQTEPQKKQGFWARLFRKEQSDE